MTSLKYPENTQVSYMKGIIEEKRVKWSDYAPIVVDMLPFYIKAKQGAPVSHPCTPWDACLTQTALVDMFAMRLSWSFSIQAKQGALAGSCAPCAHALRRMPGSGSMC